MLAVVNQRFCLGAIADGNDLRAKNELSLMQNGQQYTTDLTVLHYVQLPQPRLIEGIAGRMDDMTQPVLLCQDQH